MSNNKKYSNTNTAGRYVSQTNETSGKLNTRTGVIRRGGGKIEKYPFLVLLISRFTDFVHTAEERIRTDKVTLKTNLRIVI